MFGTPPLPAVSDADLEKMSDADLVDLEDRLLLANELDTSKRAQLSVGRVVVWVLSLVGIGIFLTLYSRLPTEKLGPLNIPLYLGALGAGVVGAHLLWSAAGRSVRNAVRWVLGHWPVALYLIAVIYRFLHRG
jgi:hypothetical protein